MSLDTSTTLRVTTSALALGLALGVAGCGTPDPGTTSTPGSTASATMPSASPIVVEDGWVKAVDAVPPTGTPSPSATASPSMAAGPGMGVMTAMFGVLRNTSSDAVTVTGASTPVAEHVELHETVKTGSGAMQMQEKQGGFVIPAGGSMTLQPGGNHIMLMGLTGDLATGSEASITLQTTAGEVSVTVPVRAFTGAEESYAPSPASS